MAEYITPVILKQHAILMTNIGKISLPVLYVPCEREELFNGTYLLNNLTYFNIEGSMFAGCDFAPLISVTSARSVENINVYITNNSGHTLGLINEGSITRYAIDGVRQGNFALCGFSAPNSSANAHTGAAGITLFADEKISWFTLNLAYCNNSSIGYSFVMPETDIKFGYYVIDGYNSSIPSIAMTTQMSLIDFLDDIDLKLITPDPYEEGGESDMAGGEGDFDGSSDPVDFPSLPNISATDASFISLYNPTIAQLKALATYMWTNPLFDLTNWKKLFADPMQAILGLSIVPVHVPEGNIKTITVGNISTDILMTQAASQYVEVDCGTLNVNEYWGAYLDYEPYTKTELYLPYIGIRSLSTDDVMHKPVHIKYHVDILSGSCCAYVKCGDSVLYTFIGQCSSSIPVTGQDWTNMINGALSIANALTTRISSVSSAHMALNDLASAAINTFKPNVERSGTISGTGGFLAIQKPYIILTRPRQALPKNQNTYLGYPSFMTCKLSTLTGFTTIEAIHLEGIPATDEELNEIESLLKKGVIF